MCMPAPKMPAPAPIAPPPAPTPPPAPAMTIQTTQPASANTSVAKAVRPRKNPLVIQKSDSVATGLNIPV